MKLHAILFLLIGSLLIKANPRERSSQDGSSDNFWDSSYNPYHSYNNRGNGKSYGSSTIDVASSTKSNTNNNINKFWSPSYLFYHDMIKTYLVSKFGSEEVSSTTEVVLVKKVTPILVPAGQSLLTCPQQKKTFVLLDGVKYECISSFVASTDTQLNLRENCMYNENNTLICQGNENNYPLYSGSSLMFRRDVSCKKKITDNVRCLIEIICVFIADEAPLPDILGFDDVLEKSDESLEITTESASYFEDNKPMLNDLPELSVENTVQLSTESSNLSTNNINEVMIAQTNDENSDSNISIDVMNQYSEDQQLVEENDRKRDIQKMSNIFRIQ